MYLSASETAGLRFLHISLLDIDKLPFEIVVSSIYTLPRSKQGSLFTHILSVPGMLVLELYDFDSSIVYQTIALWLLACVCVCVCVCCHVSRGFEVYVSRLVLVVNGYCNLTCKYSFVVVHFVSQF